MILVVAILAGVLVVLLRSGLTRRALQPPLLESVWLVAVAYLPQWLAFYNGATARLIPDPVAAASLVASQCLLLYFAWRNRQFPGIWLLAVGVAMNLSVIVANGGFMPISPKVVWQLAPHADGSWQIGERLWLTKDIVLPAVATHLPWLADRFLLPEWSPKASAFSLGDIILALGAFRVIWSVGDETDSKEKVEDFNEKRRAVVI